MPERDGYVGPTMEEEGVSSMVLQREAWYRWAGTGGQVQVLGTGGQVPATNPNDRLSTGGIREG